MAQKWICPNCGDAENFLLTETALVTYGGGFKTAISPSGAVVPEWDDEIESEPVIDWDSSAFENYWCDNCGGDFITPDMIEIPDV